MSSRKVESKRMIVAVVDESLSSAFGVSSESFAAAAAARRKNNTATSSSSSNSSSSRSIEVHNRPDPSLGITKSQASSSVHQCRPYLLVKEQKDTDKETVSLCEVQSLATDFGSFLLRPSSSSTTTTTTKKWTSPPMMVGDGSLYTVTRMDPLFFLLTADRLALTSTETKWQPLQQILDDWHDDKTLVSCLQKEQLNHLYDKMNLGDDDDDESFYKFSVQKALAWLTRKQQAVEAVLLVQQQKQAAARRKDDTSATDRSRSSGGAFCSTFHMVQEDDDNDKNKMSESADDTAATALRVQQEDKLRLERQQVRAKEESIQVVCNYLDDGSWRPAFLKHLQIVSEHDTDKVLWGKKSSSSTNKRPMTMAATTGTDTTTTTSTSSKSGSSDQSGTTTTQPKTKKLKPNTATNNNTQKNKASNKSAGLVRLEKAASYGKRNKNMQKMTSFFQAVPKKNKTTTTKENNSAVNDSKK